jgi:hypothetical protein
MCISRLSNPCNSNPMIHASTEVPTYSVDMWSYTLLILYKQRQTSVPDNKSLNREGMDVLNRYQTRMGTKMLILPLFWQLSLLCTYFKFLFAWIEMFWREEQGREGPREIQCLTWQGDTLISLHCLHATAFRHHRPWKGFCGGIMCRSNSPPSQSLIPEFAMPPLV